MKNIFYLASIAILLTLTSCAHTSHDHANEAEAHEHEMMSLTHYSDEYEYFVQYEPLISGEESCILAHITCLDDFKPLGKCDATISLGNGNVQTVKPIANGTYEIMVTPKEAGHCTLSLSFGEGAERHTASFHVDVHHSHEAMHEHGSDNHEHKTHDHAVHEHEEGEHEHEGHEHDAEHEEHEHGTEHDAHSAEEDAHSHQHADGATIIPFGKEQSWAIEFATTEVHKNRFNGAIKVAAKVSSAPENSTTIVATNAGRVKYAGNVAEGKNVVSGETLFILDGSNVTQNDAAVKFAEAESEYLVAKAEYERKKLLFGDNVASKKELEAAEAAYRSSEAHYKSMQRNFNGGNMTLRAQQGGYISRLMVANGEYVQPGTPIAELQSDGRKFITAEVPMRHAKQIRNISDANITLSDGTVLSLQDAGGAIIATGSAANGCTMLPVTLSAESLPALPGEVVTLYLISQTYEGEESITVPRTALVEEMGTYFVFVQHTPVEFEKREVKIGSTDGTNTQIIKGLHCGERVVSKGAISIKLSQGTAALDPHAGHVH